VKTWIGGDDRSFASMKGRVVVLHMWQSGIGSDRRMMPMLDRLATAHAADGLVVLGLTARKYKRGYVPSREPPTSRDEVATDGHEVDTLTAEQFVEHLQQFRKNTGVVYPFAVVDGEATGAT